MPSQYGNNTHNQEGVPMELSGVSSYGSLAGAGSQAAAQPIAVAAPAASVSEDSSTAVSANPPGIGSLVDVSA